MNNSEKIWAYVQGALDEEARLELEALLEADSALFEQLKEAEWLNHKMKTRFAARELDEKKLIDRIEQELLEASEPSDTFSETRGEEEKASLIRFPGMSAGAKGLLALAACAIVVVGLRPYPAGKLSTFQAEIGQRSVRSGKTPPDSARPTGLRYYTEEQLRLLASQANAVLENKIDEQIKKPGYLVFLQGKEEYDVTVTLHEMRAGQISMHVGVQRDKTGHPVEWEHYFKSLQACEESLEESTTEIVGLLRR